MKEQLYKTRKILMITVGILILLISIGFTSYHVNSKFNEQNEKIVELNQEIRDNKHRIASLEEKKELIEMLRHNTRDMRYHIMELEKESERTNEIIKQLHENQELFLHQLPEEQKSTAESIGNSIKDLMKGLVF